MSRRLIFLVVVLVQLVFSGHSNAARTLTWSGAGGSPNNAPFVDCNTVTQYYVAGGNTWNTPVTCSGLDTALNKVAVNGGGTYAFSYTFKNGGVLGGYVTSSGSCTANASAGDASLVAAYVSVDTGNVLQVVNDVNSVHGAAAGCKIKAVGADFCMTASSEAVNGVAKKTCVFQMVETGEIAASNSPPDDTVPAYTGGASTGTGGTGTGGTGTGTGGTGGTGDTGGTGGTGGTGTGGTGTGGTGTGGTGTGGTGTGGTGTGGTGTGGTGTGGTGTGGTNCGAPGQPACKIDESGTPSGIGGALDALNALVNGVGGDRQNGFNDAVSDAGKDTSLGFGYQLPHGSCSNPTVGLPGIGGQWTVDICSYTGTFAAMFELLWVFFFGYSVMSLVARATAKPVA
ncbi:MAG TPA: hypothetical protein VJ752_19620 [Burkholderiaceae bacterium]|nr:hypothetical protein [Burkholderiaceae bacterium]